MIKFGRPVPHDVEARLPAVVRALAGNDRPDAVWLFGSRARNEADALSDVDLALLVAPGATELRTRQLGWIATVGRVLGTDEVSVHVLNRMPVGLRAPILRHARLLWSRSREIAADFEMRPLKAYLDLQPHLAQYDRELFGQAASGTLR